MTRIVAFPKTKQQDIPIVEFEEEALLPRHMLTEENWLMYAMQNYTNPNCVATSEFFEDMRRFKYIRKLITHYERSGELKERLILNHIILLGNVLKVTALVRLLFLKIKNLAVLKPFLVALSILPKTVANVEGKTFDTDFISLDIHVIEALRKIGLK